MLRLDNAPYTIVGVMPPKVRFPSISELWIPMAPAAGAAAVTPLVASLLLNVTPNDPLGYIVVAAVLGVVALTATWIPAWTASAVDPLIALREE